MKFHLTTKTLFAIFSLQKLSKSEETASFSILDEFSCDTNVDPIEVYYHGNDTSVALWECSQITGDYYVDSNGFIQNTTQNNTKILDIFSWKINSLRGIVNSSIEAISAPFSCTYGNTTDTQQETLTCTFNSFDLALSYSSSFTPRAGYISIINPNGKLVHCLNGFNGFITTCFQNYDAPDSCDKIGGFNLLLLIPIILGSLFAIGLTAAMAYPNSRKKIVGLFSRSDENEDHYSLMEIARSRNYGSTDGSSDGSALST